MLQKNPADRISATEALSGEWISKFNKIVVAEDQKQDVAREKHVAPTMFKQLKHFYHERKLENAIVSYIHSRIQVKENEKQLLEIF